QDGQKIPKWEPRSRLGQYVRKSPLHTSTVGLIKNLNTGRISPQFHCVYDDMFETIACTHEKPPDNWEEIVVLQSHRTDWEPEHPDDPEPQLSDEWLTPDEKTKPEPLTPTPYTTQSSPHDTPISQKNIIEEMGPSPVTNTNTTGIRNDQKKEDSAPLPKKKPQKGKWMSG
ncbi:MAG: hypothetical protein AAF193_10125, partial [Bacteroidota bacterium]